MGIIIDVISKVAGDNSGSLSFIHDRVSNWYGVLLLLSGARRNLKIGMRDGRYL